jgi:3-methyladenine DNA glycosylase/8-oxoguanine DNA glycosylase
LQIKPPAGFDLDATARSHGWYDLPPFQLDGETLRHVVVIAGRAHDVTIRPGLKVEVAPKTDIRAAVTAMLQLDEDLTPFYALADEDAAVAWARARGAGRMLRAPTVFEDVIKMLLTTNCSWSLTRLMVTRLVDHLGLPAPSGRRSFPTPAAMAKKNEKYYREVIRAGYRAPHLMKISRDVASGRLDLEKFRALEDTAELREKLLELPGIGPYAAENLLRLLGHYDFLGLDSWCRGRLKELYPRARNVDAFAVRRYRKFGRFMGLAMWLDVTRHWHEGHSRPSK